MPVLHSPDEPVARLERLLKLIDDLKRLHDPAARRTLLARMSQEIQAAAKPLTPIAPRP
jgi:hypothetical protein